VAWAEDPTVSRWKTRLGESEAALTRGDHWRSLSVANRLIQEMINRLGPGQGSTEIFGLTLMHKALASAGLGRNEDALWDWHTVLALYPAFKDRDLSAYGNAGKFLMDNRDVRSALTDEQKTAKPTTDEPTTSTTRSNVTPPKIKRRVYPRYPEGARQFGVSGPMMVELIITTEGKVTSPKIVQALPAPTLSYVLLQAVRQWRFEPAKFKGVNTPVIFTLSMEWNP
jgi:TonB family protein